MRSRFAHGALLVAIGLWTVRCGTTAPAGGGSVGPTPDAGVGAPAADGGTSADAGSSADGGGTSGGSDAGTGNPDAGTGAGGGSPDAGTGGGTASDCNGLRPPSDPGAASASHFIWFRDSTGNDSCAAGVSSGTGTLALSMIADHAGTLDFVSLSGNLLSTHGGQPPFMIGGASGFIGDMRPSNMEYLEAWSDSGTHMTQTASQPSQHPAPAEDPLGGVVALTSNPPQITSYDPTLAVRWSVALPSGTPLAMAVDRAGATLFLFDGSNDYGANTVAGMWIDHEGTAGNVFEMLGPQNDRPAVLNFAMTQRTGSGLFLSRGTSWVAQIESMATASSSAPPWLEARPSTHLHMVHGGKGYAILPADGLNVSDCVQTVEVVSPSGMSCGTTTFRGATGACRTGAIAVGYEGSVIQLAPDPDPSHAAWFGPATCYWHWWTGFFR